ncbi:hypothetical protein [Nocardioides panzhihuensis]|uniref:Type II secretory pathway pseudopilin PulG n=1 Tax=Nocardioides panzhihuensis TaxID=860243 RepID=A0A7Z0DRY8_9ACTN|nr:hypothetical protein [Nocardioides panzhihuensis]NYI80624.1 type II secretory pathway pseudopilin PulG [Nocardioides panzhihuensis]
MSNAPEDPTWHDQSDWPAHPTYATPVPASESPRPRWPWVLGAVVAVVLAIVALLGTTLLADYRSEQESAEAITTCTNEIGEFVEAVLDASSRAEVGITQADLATAIGDASAFRNRIDRDELSPACDSAYRAADKALSIYAASSTTWNDCIWDDYCDPDTDFDNSDWSTAQETAQAAYDAMLAGISVDAVTN